MRTGFFKWYGKRLSRVLPVVILITVIYLLLGRYDFSIYASGTEETVLYQILSSVGITYPKWLSWFVYPTYYHFVASILVLYVPYYFILKTEYTRKHIPAIMGVLFVIYVAVYVLFYDKSYYHIDTVREPFIRFLFMESMLLGAWLKLNDEKFRNKGKSALFAAATVICFVLYFVSKMYFSRTAGSLQIFNQFIIFALLFFVMRWFDSIDNRLCKAPKWLYAVVSFIAKMTLEIYLVQYVLIAVVKNFELPFPLNWIVLTAFIIAGAFILHVSIELLTKAVETVTKKNREV